MRPCMMEALMHKPRYEISYSKDEASKSVLKYLYRVKDLCFRNEASESR